MHHHRSVGAAAVVAGLLAATACAPASQSVATSTAAAPAVASASSSVSVSPTNRAAAGSPADRKLVRRVERYLIAHGYPNGPVDGSIGASTRQALCAWRDVHGVAGGRRSSLSVAEATAILTTAARPPAERADGLYISKTCQTLFQVVDGKYKRIVRVSTAAPGRVTPSGVGKVWRKWPGWHESSLYPDGWMYDALYFRRDHPGVALHGSRSNDLVHTYPASHGCVRVWRPTIESIFRESPIGTRVVVYGAYTG